MSDKAPRVATSKTLRIAAGAVRSWCLDRMNRSSYVAEDVEELGNRLASIEQDAELKEDIKIILSVAPKDEIVYKTLTKLLTLCPTLSQRPETPQ